MAIPAELENLRSHERGQPTQSRGLLLILQNCREAEVAQLDARDLHLSSLLVVNGDLFPSEEDGGRVDIPVENAELLEESHSSGQLFRDGPHCWVADLPLLLEEVVL